MVKAMSYEGKMYGVPMQAQTHVMAYRKDLFDKNGITPPTTFEEMKAAAKLQDAEGMKYPLRCRGWPAVTLAPPTGPH